MHRVVTPGVRGRRVSQHYFSKVNTEQISDQFNKRQFDETSCQINGQHEGEEQCFLHQLHHCLSPLTVISGTLTEQHEVTM